MTERKSGKSKKTHKNKAEKINLREAAHALKGAEKKKVSLSSATTIEHGVEVTYAPEPMPEPEPIKQASPEPAHPSRALVPTAKTAGDDAAETFKQSMSAAQKGGSAVNAKLLDMAQEALNSSLEHARDLTGVTNPMQALKLQMKHWQETIENFTAHSQELRTLTAELVATTSEPIRAHLRRAQK